MSTFLSSVFAVFITIPLLGYLLVFLISKGITGNHRRSVQRALNVSTFLLILSVHFLVITIWDKSFFWVILIILFLGGMSFAVLHWKTKGEIIFLHMVKGFWRFNFLLFFLAYLTLILFGLIQRIAITVSAP